jgi:hypothetical protein
MSDTREQNLSSHARLHPPYHFVLLPLLVANLIITIVWAVKQPDFHSI